MVGERNNNYHPWVGPSGLLDITLVYEPVCTEHSTDSLCQHSAETTRLDRDCSRCHCSNIELSSMLSCTAISTFYRLQSILPPLCSRQCMHGLTLPQLSNNYQLMYAFGVYSPTTVIAYHSIQMCRARAADRNSAGNIHLRHRPTTNQQGCCHRYCQFLATFSHNSKLAT